MSLDCFLIKYKQNKKIIYYKIEYLGKERNVGKKPVLLLDLSFYFIQLSSVVFF